MEFITVYYLTKSFVSICFVLDASSIHPTLFASFSIMLYDMENLK